MSRTVIGVLAAACVGVLAGAMPVWAHHSFAAVFDADKSVTVHGVITEIRLENPHSWFFLEVTDASGKVVKWGFEGSTPTSLIRSGFKPNTLKIGDEVTVKGSHARDASKNEGAAREMITKDGRSFIVGPAGNETTGPSGY